jgi:hypothetical protein
MTNEFEDLEVPEFDFQAHKDAANDKPADPPTNEDDENEDNEELDLGSLNDDDEDTDPPKSDEESGNYVKAAYDLLTQFGIIEEDEKFDNNEDSLKTKLEELPDRALASAISQLPSESQKLLNFVAVAKQDLTVDELFDFVKSMRDETRPVTLDTADEAREFLEKQLTTQGLSKRAIQAELDELEESETLVQRAKELLNSQAKKTEALLDSKKSNQAQRTASNQQFYSSVQQELEAAGWKKNKQQEILTAAPKANQILTEVMSSPKAYVQLIDFLTKFTGKEFNLADYEKRGESKAVSNIKDIIEKNSINSGGLNTKGTQDTEKRFQRLQDKYEPVV